MKVFSEERRKPRVQTVNTLPSRTVQDDVHRSEIKRVLAKYKQVGIVDNLRSVDLEFRDVTEFSDFSDMMLQSARAADAFMRLPSKVREVFDHDPAVWLKCAADSKEMEARRPELEALGVLEPKAPAQPVEQRAGPSKGQPRERRRSSAPAGGSASAPAGGSAGS